MNEQVNSFITQATQSIQSGQFNQALDLANQAIALDEGNSEAHLLRAIALSQTNQPQAATNAFNESIRLDPRSVKAYYNLSVHLYQQGDKEQALQAAQGALAMDASHSGAREMANRIQGELGVGQPAGPQATNPYEGGAAPYARPTGQFEGGHYGQPAHSVAFVENMGKNWPNIGWGIVIASIIYTIISWAIAGPMMMEMMNAMTSGDQAALENMSRRGGMMTNPLLSIIGLLFPLAALIWTAVDIADRRGSWLWMIPTVLCCCCGYAWIPQAIYMAAGRNK